jgi:DNA transposition AAA+ family ATPase
MEDLVTLLNQNNLLSTVKKVGGKFKFGNNSRCFSLAEVKAQIFKVYGIVRETEEIEQLLEEWVKKNKTTEKDISDRLARELKGQREVKTPAGYIDVLTADEVIEVKEAKKWKGAIGQVISYQEFYRDKGKRVHLYGEVGKGNLDAALKICKENGIKLTYESLI